MVTCMRFLVLSIQVIARERTPVVAVDDAVRIEHRDHLEDSAFSQPARVGVEWICEELEQAFHDP